MIKSHRNSNFLEKKENIFLNYKKLIIDLPWEQKQNGINLLFTHQLM